MERSQVLVLGDANVDLVIPLREQVPGAAAVTGSSLELHGGGTAGNTAAALARLEEDVLFIGTAGDDGFGRWVVNDFIQEGVDTSHIQLMKDACTSMVLAVIHPDGERDLFVWPDSGGAHTMLSPDSITKDLFKKAAWLHTTGLCLREEPVRSAQLKAMRIAKECGTIVSLDLNLRLESWGMDETLKSVFDQALDYSDVVFGSGGDEILPFTKQISLQAGAELLCAGRRTAIARLGAKGALVIAPDEMFESPAYSVEVVDSVGAGDAFNGGFISARMAGKDLADSVCWGNATAALKLKRSGARGLPTRQELLDFLAESS